MHGKGKSKKNTAIDKKVRTYSDKNAREALNPNYFVMAKMKAEMDEADLVKAKIIDCRLKKSIDANNTVLSKDSYEYYLHFCHTDRRMDRWIPSEWIKPTTDYIDPEPKKKKDGAGEGDSDEEHHEGMDHQERLAHEEATKLKTIFKVKFGRYYAETWYYSPYPDEFHDIECIFYCEFCLSFFVSENELNTHLKSCNIVHPPGNQIYKDEDNKITVWEIDPNTNTTYCENLSYLSKLFLDHKLLIFPIDPFLFFMLCEYDDYGHHLVGYFSKNKYFHNGYNLSCILTLPFYQRKGYGKFLMNLSYELSKIEKKIGTPERPLSDLGRQSYLSWWTQRIIDYIREKVAKNQDFSLEEMSQETSITLEDIVDSLENVKLIKKHKGDIMICTDPALLDDIYKSYGKPAMKVNLEKLHWVPYLDPSREQPK